MSKILSFCGRIESLLGKGKGMKNILKKIGTAIWCLVLLFLMTGLITPEWKFALQLILVYSAWWIIIRLFLKKRRTHSAENPVLNDEFPNEQAELESEIKETAAEKFKIRKIPERKANQMTEYEVERYAAMCNAYLERQDEMEKYNEKYEN